MIQRDQSERAKAPKYESMGEARQRPLPNHLALQHDFGEELPNAFAERRQAELDIRLGLANLADDFAEAHPESEEGSG